MDLVNIRRIFYVLCMVMEKSSKGVVNVKINNNKSNARVKNVEMVKWKK